MEFTPRKQVIPNYDNGRRTPYSTGSSTHYKRFKKRLNQSVSPRPSILTTSPQTYSQKRFMSRAERIVNMSAKIFEDADVPRKERKGIQNSPSPQGNKRPLSAVNAVDNVKEQTFPSSYSSDREADTFDNKRKHNDENDPYNFCTSLDFDGDKRPKPDLDKSSTFGSLKVTVVRAYPNKKRQTDAFKSRFSADLSPESIEKTNTITHESEAEKENMPDTTTTAIATTGDFLTSREPSTTLPHLIGFPNYGNTCYLNSVVQALLGLSPFLGDLQKVSVKLNFASTSLSSGLNQLIGARTKGQVSLVKQSLKTVKENLVRVDESFSGCKMQDANEFLTRILDTIKDEIDRCHVTTPSPDRSLSSQDDFEEIFPYSSTNQKVMSRLGKNLDKEMSLQSEERTTTNDGDTVEQILVNECEDPLSEITENDLLEPEPVSDPLQLSPVPTTTPNREEETMPRNPIKDNFEFQLLESYRCLGCNEVQGKVQDYFGLYVNLPEENNKSIQDSLSSCMGEDLRELKCEKCAHNQSSVVTSVTKLPRILIVQLKRYEYKPDQGESIKRFWRVPVTRWLTLDDYVCDATGPSQWVPYSGSVAPRANKQATLTVRNLSSELNVCEGRKDQEPPVCSPSPLKPENVNTFTSDKEDKDLQEVMQRSMEDIGSTKEEDDIQQAIRLSLQDLGMSYTNENQRQTDVNEVEEEENHKLQIEENEEQIKNHRHTFRLISVISHFGSTTNTGHYVADVYNCEEKSWFHYDDETVSRIPESVVLAEGRQKNGYIFFYLYKDVFHEIQKKANLHR